MVAYNDETFGAYKSALQESLLNQLGYTNVATGTSGLTLENLVSMDPESVSYTHLFVKPSCTVDTLHHSVVAISTPVSTCYMEKVEDLDTAC